MGSVPRSVLEPQRSFSINATGTLRVLEHVRAGKAKRVIFAGSSSAYGDQKSAAGQPAAKVETQLPSPLSPYAASKLAGEHLIAVYAHCYGLSTASLRYFNVFGPRQSADSQYAAAVAAITRRLLDGLPPIIYGDGLQSRDFTFVGNAVLATLLAGCPDKSLRGEAINIGTGRRVSILDLASAIASALGIPAPAPQVEPARVGDVRDSLADISRARQLLGYEPFATLEDGLAETVAWAKSTLADADPGQA
jgi:nucleoside-diphosphate-sugar epimerase